MRIYDAILTPLLFVLPFLFLTSYSAPVLSHSSVDSLAPRGILGSIKNAISKNPAPCWGSVAWVPTVSDATYEYLTSCLADLSSPKDPTLALSQIMRTIALRWHRFRTTCLPSTTINFPPKILFPAPDSMRPARLTQENQTGFTEIRLPLTIRAEKRASLTH